MTLMKHSLEATDFMTYHSSNADLGAGQSSFASLGQIRHFLQENQSRELKQDISFLHGWRLDIN